MQRMSRSLGIAFVLAAATAANAQKSAEENYAEYNPFPFSQLNSGVTDPSATNALRQASCVNTAVANGLMYLSNYYGLYNNPKKLMLPGYGTVNALSTAMATDNDGTYIGNPDLADPGMVLGTANYIGPKGQNVNPPVHIVGGQVLKDWPNQTTGGYNIQQNTTPTAVQLYNWLNANDAVEMGIHFTDAASEFSWHCLTLLAIDINADGKTGTMSFIDPWGGAVTNPGGNSSGGVTISNATFTTTGGGQLMITAGYVGGCAGGVSKDDPTGSSTGTIMMDFAQAVPEPPAYLALGAGAVLLFRRRRRARGRGVVE